MAGNKRCRVRVYAQSFVGDLAELRNWYTGSRNEIGSFEIDSGDTLLNSEVDQLVATMAAFEPGDGTEPAQLYDDNVPAAVQTVVASSWQQPA